VKADRLRKHKGGGRESRLGRQFPVVLPAILTVRLRRERVTTGRPNPPRVVKPARPVTYFMSMWPPEW
jgi:hypothetical protein